VGQVGTFRLSYILNSQLIHYAGARTVFGSRAFCLAAPTIWNSLYPADLTDNFNSMILSGFTCSLINVFLQTFIYVRPSHRRYPRLRFVSLNWNMVHHQLH